MTWYDDMTMAEIDKLSKEINSQDYEHVFQVTRRGCVDGPVGIYAPEVRNAEPPDDIYIDDAGQGKWSALTGYTGQWNYHGAVMHPSEFIGGRLAEDMISNSAEQEEAGSPLLWAAVLVHHDGDETEDNEDDLAGWAVVYREI